MAGGILNLIAVGNQNIILNGNPTKSFFKKTYAKYTNFGMQKYRIDQTGQTNLHLTQFTFYRFKIPRYAELLMDIYLVIKLPNIWSPILKYINPYNNLEFEYRPYHFQWIKNIGSQIIDEVSFTIDGRVIQKYSGRYLQNMVERDFDNNKREIFNRMTGNYNELNDPANFSNRNNNYPNSYKLNNNDIDGIEPSIKETNLYIPINSWFSLSSFMAFPLISLQQNILEVNFKLKPLQELFTIKDVIYDISLNTNNISTLFDNNTFFNYRYNYDDIPRIQPEQNKDINYAYHRFIQPPPYTDISSIDFIYPDQRNNINYDIHLVCTQCFLDTDERNLFLYAPREYLIKEINEYKYEKINKSTKIKIESNGLISNWMWYFQRNDVNKRNEWSNYTNWEYINILPNKLEKLYDTNNNELYYNNSNFLFNNPSKNIFITGNQPSIYQQTNQKYIMKNFGILVDGKYREDILPSEIYNFIEKYRNSNNLSDGVYLYNFSLDNNINTYQPSGSFNTNKFRNIEFEFNIYENPPLDLSSVQFNTICDPETGLIIATSKEPTSIYKYNYDLYIFEEKYNILRFQSGMADLIYSR